MVILNKSAETVAEVYFNQWTCRHRTPEMLLSDKKNICKLMGIQKSRTTHTTQNATLLSGSGD
jgi:hypothetical protein